MEMKLNNAQTSELLELMEIPEIRQVVLAKLEQAKLIFSKEIKTFYKEKYPNLIKFPGREQIRAAANDSRGKDANHQTGRNRIEWDYRRGFFDTTCYMKLSEDEQIALFREYFDNNKKFRREILYEFFLKKMPYSDIYENIG